MKQSRLRGFGPFLAQMGTKVDFQMGPEVNFPNTNSIIALLQIKISKENLFEIYTSVNPSLKKLQTVASKGIFDWNRRIVYLKDRLV